MTEHKFTDEEVILAHRCCTDIGMGCLDCPFGNNEKAEGCASLNKLVLDLINRQNAEIAYWMDVAVNEKRETAKEFAERAKRRLPIVSPCVFDQIVKALTEENV